MKEQFEVKPLATSLQSVTYNNIHFSNRVKNLGELDNWGRSILLQCSMALACQLSF